MGVTRPVKEGAKQKELGCVPRRILGHRSTRQTELEVALRRYAALPRGNPRSRRDPDRNIHGVAINTGEQVAAENIKSIPPDEQGLVHRKTGHKLLHYTDGNFSPPPLQPFPPRLEEAASFRCAFLHPFQVSRPSTIGP